LSAQLQDLKIAIMLTSVHHKNYRAFEDTGEVQLSRLNVFLGANNAGKTSFVSTIELLLRSLQGGGSKWPLVFQEMASFASFNTVLRRHWSPRESRPKHFNLGYRLRQGSKEIEVDFECSGNPKDDTPVVDRALYKIGGLRTNIKIVQKDGSSTKSERKKSARKSDEIVVVSPFFHGILPLLAREDRKLMGLVRQLYESGIFNVQQRLEVIHPSRPIPRSYYVIDDPGLTTEDRELITFLLRTWDVADSNVKKRIIDNLNTLGLTKAFDVIAGSPRVGPKVVEIRVAPTLKRQKVTIADAGFGLSQVLPLIAYEARLSNGCLIAYQPELHLHPRAQSRLADIFADSVARGNQLFIETHSQDFILRLQLLMAEGKLNPADVSVFCFDQDRGRARISTMKFSDFGIPLASWPRGFLDTSLMIARELNSVRVKERSHN
jgi:hypothetical protein